MQHLSEHIDENGGENDAQKDPQSMSKYLAVLVRHCHSAAVLQLLRPQRSGRAQRRLRREGG
jgi:hypothetical protein